MTEFTLSYDKLTETHTLVRRIALQSPAAQSLCATLLRNCEAHGARETATWKDELPRLARWNE